MPYASPTLQSCVAQQHGSRTRVLAALATSPRTARVRAPSHGGAPSAGVGERARHSLCGECGFTMSASLWEARAGRVAPAPPPAPASCGGATDPCSSLPRRGEGGAARTQSTQGEVRQVEAHAVARLTRAATAVRPAQGQRGRANPGSRARWDGPASALADAAADKRAGRRGGRRGSGRGAAGRRVL
jgi:hypothetical protein